MTAMSGLLQIANSMLSSSGIAISSYLIESQDSLNLRLRSKDIEGKFCPFPTAQYLRTLRRDEYQGQIGLNHNLLDFIERDVIRSAVV